MARVLLIVLVLVVAAGGWAVAARSLLVGRREVNDPRLALDPGTYRNHQAMARWIDARVQDDLVRPLIPEPEQERARALLAEYYGEEP